MCIRDRHVFLSLSLSLKIFLLIFFSLYFSLHSCLLYTSYAADDLTRVYLCCLRFFQAEDGIRDLVRSRGLGDVYKRQTCLSLSLSLFEYLFIDFFFTLLFPTLLSLIHILRCRRSYACISLLSAFFSSRRRHTRSSTVSWARRCV